MHTHARQKFVKFQQRVLRLIYNKKIVRLTNTCIKKNNAYLAKLSGIIDNFFRYKFSKFVCRSYRSILQSQELTVTLYWEPSIYKHTCNVNTRGEVLPIDLMVDMASKKIYQAVLCPTQLFQWKRICTFNQHCLSYKISNRLQFNPSLFPRKLFKMLLH